MMDVKGPAQSLKDVLIRWEPSISYKMCAGKQEN